jgi:hypothetical protein
MLKAEVAPDGSVSPRFIGAHFSESARTDEPSGGIGRSFYHVRSSEAENGSAALSGSDITGALEGLLGQTACGFRAAVGCRCLLPAPVSA